MIRNKIASLSRLQQIFLMIIVITVPVSLAVGWWLVSPLFLSGATGEETIDEVDSEVLLIGSFNTVDGSHYGIGDVKVLVDDQSQRTLFFDDVELSNGPDLFVYLSKKSAFQGAISGEDPGEFFNLGALDFTMGSFSFDIPDEVDLTEYITVIIWCKLFAVGFTWAVLHEP